MDRINNVLFEVIDDAKTIGFSVPDSLERQIYIDKNRRDRVGACYRYRWPTERYEIHLSEDTLGASLSEIKNIIAHEVLHTSWLTENHGRFWSMYSKMMNCKLGYDIKVQYVWSEILKK